MRKEVAAQVAVFADLPDPRVTGRCGVWITSTTMAGRDVVVDDIQSERKIRRCINGERLVRKVHDCHFAGQSAGRSPIAHSFGGSPSAVFWYIQLPQTVQFHLLLTFVMLPGGPTALTPEAARWACGGTLDGFPTSSRQASQGCIYVAN